MNLPPQTMQTGDISDRISSEAAGRVSPLKILLLDIKAVFHTSVSTLAGGSDRYHFVGKNGEIHYFSDPAEMIYRRDLEKQITKIQNN